MGIKEDGEPGCSRCPVERQETSGMDWNTGHCKEKKTFFYYKGDWTLAQAAKGGCGDSTLEDIQRSTGRGPGHPAPADPAWTAGLD